MIKYKCQICTMKNTLLLFACFLISTFLKAQNKNYQVAAISFYNFENCLLSI